jgi:lipoprotein-anchoring transpeptidase ErfK/SrfK
MADTFWARACVDASVVAIIATQLPQFGDVAATRGRFEVVRPMRAMLFLLLGGALLWLVWENSGLARAKSGAESEAPGVLVPVAASSADAGHIASRPAQDAPGEEGVDVSDTASAASSPEANVDARSVAETPVAATPPAAVSSSDSPSDRSLEIAIASELAHRPGQLAEFLGAKGRDVPAGQREFALVFAGIATRSPEESREAARRARAVQGLTDAELALLDQLIAATDQRAVPASATETSPLVKAASMCWLAYDAERALAAAHHRDASRVYSELLLDEIDAPWPADADALRRWSAQLARAQARYHWEKSADWPAVELKVEKGDSLISIRKRLLEQHPEMLVCTGQIERANGIRGTTIQPGQLLRVPTSKAHVLVDLDAHWVFYMLGDVVAAAWEAGIGKASTETRPGEYTVGEKRTEPMWFPAGRDPVPFGDPANPLGTRWIAWLNPDGTTSRLGFHGTNDPDSVGRDRSEGCIRLRNQDVEELFEILPKGAAITVRP